MMKTRILLPIVAVAFALLTVSPLAHGVTRNKANNEDNLNLPSSWSLAVVPGAADVAAWTSAVTGTNSVQLGADLTWLGISIASPGGLVTIGGANTLTLGKSGIGMSTATADLTINSTGLTLGGEHQLWNVASGRILTASPTTFTRTAGATLNIQGLGTVATTTITNTNGIVGPWASIGAGTTTRYATVSGGNIVAYTGTTAATGAAVTDTSGTANYDLTASSGTFGSSASVNTLRFAANGTIAGNLTANGLLSANGTTTLSGNITIGSTKELVLTGGSGGFTFNGVIQDNVGGASKVIVNSVGGNMIFSGSNTFSGGLVFNNFTAGYTIFNNTSALGTGNLTIRGGLASGNPGGFFFGTSATGVMDIFNNSVNFDSPDAASSGITLHAWASSTSQGFQINEITGNFGGSGGHTPGLNATGKTIRVLNGISATGVNANGIRLFASTTGSSTYEFGGSTGANLLNVGFGATGAQSANVLFSGNTTQAGGVNIGAAAGTSVNTFGIINVSGSSTFSGAQNIANAAGSGFVNYVAKDGGSRMKLSGVINDSTQTVGLQINHTYSDNINGANTPVGIVELSNNNTYDGGTTVYAGTLLISNPAGSATGTGNVSVQGGATLAGTGTIAPGSSNGLTVLSTGIIAPGDGGIGNLTINGGSTGGTAATFSSGAVFAFDLNATTEVSDRLVLLNGASGDFAFNGNTINFNILTGTIADGQQYILFSGTNANQFGGLLTTDGSGYITAGLSIGTGLTGGFENSNLQVVGTDIVLNVIAVPEPGTMALLAFSLTTVLVLRRRRE